MLAKDMKWPHCKGSVVLDNTWNTGLDVLMEIMLSSKNAAEAWWCCDTDLKYLNLRIDTRDNAFILTVDNRKDGGEKQRIDPQRVVDAIDKWHAMKKQPMVEPPPTFGDEAKSAMQAAIYAVEHMAEVEAEGGNISDAELFWAAADNIKRLSPADAGHIKTEIRSQAVHAFCVAAGIPPETEQCFLEEDIREHRRKFDLQRKLD